MDNTPRVLAGRYEVGELVGRGGMAEVHIGHDTRLGRTVAIKVLRSDLARDPSFLTRFRREAQSAAALNHPAVVAVYDTGEDVHQNAQGEDVHVPFIVMEYVEGHTVRDILTDGAAVPIEEAVEITVGVLSALEYSHHAGIVHRDIKPANVMITPTGAVKVMDFGIARAMADSAATMTQTHAVIGTAQYLSPEQARGEQVDTRSDLYSTGCMLFELLTGRPPFQGDSPVAVAYQHVGQEPQRPSEIATDVPEVLDRITLKALTKDRDQRYSTAAEFRRDLEAAMRGGQVTAPMVGAGAMMGATQVAGQPAYGATQVMAPTPNAWGPATAQQSPVTPGSGYPGPGARPDQRQPEKKSRALMWWLLGIALAAVAAIVIAMIVNGQDNAPQTVPVPTIAENLTADEARQQIEAAGLTFEQAIDKDSDLEEGRTTGRTDPAAGEEVAPSSTVTVYVAGAPGQVTLPDLKNLSEADARAKLEELKLNVGESQTENSPDVAEGMVTKTEPGGGQTVQEGSDVVLYLSTGQVTVPDLAGQTREAAEQQLKSLGLNFQFKDEETEDVNEGLVVRTDPTGDVDQRSYVTVFLAKAPQKQETTVPVDLVGKSLEEAQLACTGAQISCQQASEEPSDVFPEPGTVIRSDPAPGSQVEVGSYVNLVVSSGPANGGGGEGGGEGEGDGGDIFP